MNDDDQLVENLPALHPVCLGSQHPIDHFAHHRQAQWKGLPASEFDRLRKPLLGKQDLCIVTGACARVFVNSLLHDEGRLRIDEFRERLPVANRRSGAKQISEQLHRRLSRKVDRGQFASLSGICQVQCFQAGSLRSCNIFLCPKSIRRPEPFMVLAFNVSKSAQDRLEKRQGGRRAEGICIPLDHSIRRIATGALRRICSPCLNLRT